MSFLSKLFKSTSPIQFELGQLGVDMHSHLIPGIDDGSPSMDHTIAMLAKFEQLGYRKVITTPHILNDVHPNTPKIILDGLAKVKAEMQRLGMNIELEAAAEYYCDETFLPLIENDEILSFGPNLVLIEFGFLSPSQYEAQALFNLQVAGYTPVIAHFERYPYFFGDLKKVEELRDRNIQIQVNLNSLTGHYGQGVRKMAEQLIDHKMV
ncbi:MAG: tyrosine-protein phosphatase, partial [Flavobacteriales bacterium]